MKKIKITITKNSAETEIVEAWFDNCPGLAVSKSKRGRVWILNHIESGACFGRLHTKKRAIKAAQEISQLIDWTGSREQVLTDCNKEIKEKMKSILGVR